MVINYIIIIIIKKKHKFFSRTYFTKWNGASFMSTFQHLHFQSETFSTSITYIG